MKKFFNWVKKNEGSIYVLVSLFLLILNFIFWVLCLFENFKFFIPVVYMNVFPFTAGYFFGSGACVFKDSLEASTDVP